MIEPRGIRLYSTAFATFNGLGVNPVSLCSSITRPVA